MDRVVAGAKCGSFDWLGVIVALLIGVLPGYAEKGVTRVAAVKGKEVVLEAGRADDLQLGAEVLLLRTSEPIVHPLSGEVLGQADEPVGIVRITSVDNGRAWGRLEKAYGKPRVGDMAEYTRAPSGAPVQSQRPVTAPPSQTRAPVPVAPAPSQTPVTPSAVAPVRPGPAAGGLEVRLGQLEKEFRQWRQSKVEFNGAALDELSAMQAVLSQIDRRLADVEHQLVVGGVAPENEREFSIRYSEDTLVQLKVAGKTMTIDVVPDSTGGAAAPTAEAVPLPAETGVANGPLVEPVPPEELPLEELPPAVDGLEEPWYSTADLGESSWILAFSILFFGMVAGFVSYAIKRKYESGIDDMADPLFGDYDNDFDEDDDEDFDEDDDYLEDQDLDEIDEPTKAYK